MGKCWKVMQNVSAGQCMTAAGQFGIVRNSENTLDNCICSGSHSQQRFVGLGHVDGVLYIRSIHVHQSNYLHETPPGQQKYSQRTFIHRANIRSK